MRTIRFWHKVNKYKILLLMLLPATIYVVVFNYLPMSGIVLAFKDYNYADGVFGSPWNGLNNFRFFFQSGQAFKVTRNTVLFNVAFISFNLLLQLSVAVFLSEIKGIRFKKTAQTFMFLPHFLSWVVISVIAFNLLNYENGVFNKILENMGFEKIQFYTTPKHWTWLMVFFNAWKGVGYGSILYLAAIMGIDTSIYEAAEIDGANVFQRIFKITIPSLKPTIVILLLLSIGGIFRGNFDMFYNLIGRNGLLYDVTDVIDTFTFRSLLTNNDIGMSAASGLYQSVFCFITILIANGLVKRYDRDYSLF